MVESPPGSRRLERTFAVYDGPILVLVVCLAALTVVSLLRSESLTLTHSAMLNLAITTAAVIAAFGAAYFALTEFLLYGWLASFWIGVAFLLLADANLGTGLIPILAGWQDKAGSAHVWWGVQQSLGGLLLVLAARSGARAELERRRGRVGSGVALTAVFAAGAALGAYTAGAAHPPLFLQEGVQLVSGALFFIAGVLFWRESRTVGRIWFLWLSLILGIGGFAQLQYAIQPYSPGVVQAGDMLRLVFFVGILLGLLAEWGRNYRTLRAQTNELAVLHALLVAPGIEHPAEVIRHVSQVIGAALQCETRVVLTGQPLPDFELPAAEASRRDPIAFREQDGRSGLAAPLVAGGRRLGTLVVRRPPEGRFGSQDVRLLQAFAAQTSILLERSLLYEEVAAGAVLEERSRLAREIHDGLAQHLAFLKMRVSWLQRTRTSFGADQLQDIEGVLTTALAEARQAITTLRTDVGATSTAEAIISYVEEFARLSELRVTVLPDDGAPEVGPRARVELLRIVQEALNNVRKHAQATAVQVAVREVDHGLQIQICDDGAGFSSAESPEGHFGLEIMRERAQAIGGELSIHSELEAGTDVTIWVPGHGEEPELRLTGSSG